MENPLAGKGEQLKNGLMNWGVPLVGLISGILVGDAVGLGKFLSGIIPVKIGEKAMGILVAAGYSVGGALIMHSFGVIGKFIGALLFGMAISSAYAALAGKPLVLPGFLGGA